MRVVFRKGHKVTEYGLKVIPRAGDFVRVDGMYGTVDQVNWNYGDGEDVLSPPYVDVILT